MKKFGSIVAALLVLLIGVSGQSPDNPACPKITVLGPAGVTRPGEPLSFSAVVTGQVPADITYTWTVSSGQILEGQGTSKIKVSTERWKEIKTAATVKIGGLREGCPDTDSETASVAVHWQTFRAAEFVEFSRYQDIENLSAIDLDAVTIGPFSIFIVAEVSAGKTEDEIKARAKEIKRYLVNERKVPEDRISYYDRKSKDAKTSVYLVPLGSDPPECEDCLKIELVERCPEISMVGPAGIVRLGDSAEFAANVSEGVENIRFEWTVSRGAVEEGQGRPWIRVRTSEKDRGEIINVSVSIDGLPEGCKNEGAGYAVVDPGHGFSLLDEYGKIPIRDEFGRLDTAAAELERRKGMVLFFTVFVAPGESDVSVRKRAERIHEHLVDFRKVRKEDLVIAFSERE